MENIIENHNQLKCREQVTMWCSAPTYTSTTQLLHLRLRDHSRKREGKNGKFAVIMYLLEMSEKLNYEILPTWLPS